MSELFPILSFNTAKAIAVPVTATLPGAPQTVISVTTPSLPSGTFMIGYSFQVTYLFQNRPLFFKIGGTYPDASFFSDESSGNSELNRNRLYMYPKEHAGGPITLSLDVYDELAEAVIDFADVMVARVS